MDDAVVESGIVTSTAFEFRQMSGIMGFAWSNIASSRSHTFVEQLAQANSLESNIFSFHLGRGVDTLSDGQGFQNGTVEAGSVTIGGMDNSTVGRRVFLLGYISHTSYSTPAILTTFLLCRKRIGLFRLMACPSTVNWFRVQLASRLWYVLRL